jgi:SAM-dependent methyltransferase
VTKDAVRAYYASFGEREWQRLTNPDDGAVEFVFTKELLTRYLPPSGRILDLGGGPGRYTIWLAQRGYQVVLADLSPELLAIGRTRTAITGVSQQVEAVVEAMPATSAAGLAPALTRCCAWDRSIICPTHRIGRGLPLSLRACCD